MEVEEVVPPAELLRKGPPLSVRELDRAPREKWGCLRAVVPVVHAEQGRYDFVERGPYTLPLGVLRPDAQRGAQDAWRFFMHPADKLPRDAAWWNEPAKACLGARLVVRGARGLWFYDEVGAQLPGAETVAESYHAALGELRRRALGLDAPDAAPAPYARDLLLLDLDLLELLRLITLLVKTSAPVEAMRELARLLERPAVRRFADDVLSADERDVLLASPSAEAFGYLAGKFRVEEADFTQVVDVKDERGRQAIRELLDEFAAFEAEHGAHVQELSRGIAEAEAKLLALRERILELQRAEAGRSRISRMFSRGAIAELAAHKAEGVRTLRHKRALEAEFDALPGYARVRGLTRRVQDFQQSVAGVHRAATSFFDHNVSQQQLKAMRQIVAERIETGDQAGVAAGLKNYDLRLRADVLPRVMTMYSLSAYVLRRPDALCRGASLWTVRRIHRLSHLLIDYFRHVRYGGKSLGEAFDESWGQVLQLEKQL